jgi:hypothetical protein
MEKSALVLTDHKNEKAATLGLEPNSRKSEVSQKAGAYESGFAPLTHGLTHDPDFLLLVAHWPEYPAAIPKEIVRLSRSWPKEERP